jgi:aminoglycoside 3-N-acetyltransferase
VKFDYNYLTLKKSLAELRLEKGDLVFSHSNIGFFGRPEGINNSNDLCEMFFDAITNKIGETGTLVVPTFTYSFPRKQIFIPNSSESEMGIFAEWIRKHPDSHRSLDSSYSVSAIGSKAKKIVENVPNNSFGEDSFFDRFHREKGKILNLNFDAGSTFIHYVERCLDVPYRFDKTFKGQISHCGELKDSISTIWVRSLSDDNLEFDSLPFHKLAYESGAFAVSKIGRGYMGLITADATYGLISKSIINRPWLLTKAETLGFKSP